MPGVRAYGAGCIYLCMCYHMHMHVSIYIPCQEYERMVRELQKKYEAKMKILRDDLELRRKVRGR